MTTRERERSDRSLVGPTGTGNGSSTPDAGERAQRLMQAADRAIQATLSEHCARFLAQNRQEGGQ
jgi:hypothetical protein